MSKMPGVSGWMRGGVMCLVWIRSCQDQDRNADLHTLVNLKVGREELTRLKWAHVEAKHERAEVKRKREAQEGVFRRRENRAAKHDTQRFFRALRSYELACAKAGVKDEQGGVPPKWQKKPKRRSLRWEHYYRERTGVDL